MQVKSKNITLVINMEITELEYNRDSQQKKKRTCRIVEFSVPVDYSVKLKESEKRDKY